MKTGAIDIKLAAYLIRTHISHAQAHLASADRPIDHYEGAMSVAAALHLANGFLSCLRSSDQEDLDTFDRLADQARAVSESFHQILAIYNTKALLLAAQAGTTTPRRHPI